MDTALSSPLEQKKNLLCFSKYKSLLIINIQKLLNRRKKFKSKVGLLKWKTVVHTKETGTGKIWKYTVFITFTLHTHTARKYTVHSPLQWPMNICHFLRYWSRIKQNQPGWDEGGMWYTCGRREIHTGFWWGNKKSNLLADLHIGWEANINIQQALYV